MASTEVVAFDLSKLQLARRNVEASMPPPLGFLKMSKQGEWLYGAEGDEIPEGTQFAVNMNSFQRGWVAWADTEKGAPAAKLDEKMFPMHQDNIEPGDPPKGSRGYEPQFGFNLKAINGKLAGTELQYRASSDGGRRAIAALVIECTDGVSENPGKMPLIELSSRSYKHKSWGKLYAPVIEIVKWVSQPTTPAAKVKPAPKRK